MEVARGRIELTLGDRKLSRPYGDPVVEVDPGVVAAPARRGRRPRAGDDDGVCVVSRAGRRQLHRRHVALVQVPAQNQIHARPLRRIEGPTRAAGDVVLAQSLQQQQVVVKRQHPKNVQGLLAEKAFHLGDVLRADPAALDGPAMGRVEPERREPVADKRRRHVGVDPLAEALGRPPQPVEGVVPPRAHVVVARHDEDRRLECVQHGPRLPELPPSRPLRQVAGDDDQVEPGAVDLVHQRRHHAVVRDPAEVDVRQVRDPGPDLVDRRAGGGHRL